MEKQLPHCLLCFYLRWATKGHVPTCIEVRGNKRVDLYGMLTPSHTKGLLDPGFTCFHVLCPHNASQTRAPQLLMTTCEGNMLMKVFQHWLALRDTFDTARSEIRGNADVLHSCLMAHIHDPEMQ